MKKILFISNISNRITNFSLPSIYAAKNLGYEFHMAANYSNFNDEPEKYDVKLHHIDLDRNPFSKQNIIAYKQMLELIEKEKFDVIHCNTPIGGVLGRLCGKKADVPKVIYTAHGFHFYKGASLINRTIFKWAEMWMARYTDAIITINQEDYQAALKLKLRKGGKVYYIPGVGVDTSLMKVAKPKREEVLKTIKADNDSVLLISVGELNKNKNNEVIIKALGKLKNPKIHYILCGTGDERDKLFSLGKRYEIEKNLHFFGYRTDIPELLKSCDIFVMPSYREGLSRSLMEAMAAGLPVIASKVRGNVDLIVDGVGGFLRTPDDIEGFAESINILVQNNSLRIEMKNNNLETIKKCDIENVKKGMLEIYCSQLMR
jgi:glycosyltransferase involved in cell wall biosynthesis